MTLVDSSAWIEFLRGSQGPAADFVREHAGVDLLTTEPILMELLAGVPSGAPAHRLGRLLLSQDWVRVEPGLDYRGAVEVFHACRDRGHQIRALSDCLIAAVALRAGVPVAHRDADFEHIAAATGLVVVDLRG